MLYSTCFVLTHDFVFVFVFVCLFVCLFFFFFFLFLFRNTDWNGAFNYARKLDFLTNCIKKTKGMIIRAIANGFAVFAEMLYPCTMML